MSDQPSYAQPSTTSSLAVVSLIFGILTWFLLPFIGAIVAIICGHLARREIRRSPLDARVDGAGMAIAGLVLGYVQALMVLLVVLLAFRVFISYLGFLGWH